MRDINAEAFGPLTILIVDDDRDALELLSQKLHGHEIIKATGGVEAIAVMIRSGAVLDAVVSDYRMPAKNGAEVLRAAERYAPRAARVLLTAWPPSDIENLIDGGVVHCCLRKTSVDALREELEILTRHHPCAPSRHKKGTGSM